MNKTITFNWGEIIRWLFMMMKHKINNTGCIWNGDETEGWNEAKPKGNVERFFNLHFLDQKWSKDLEFALAKLRGLCKYLASVYNSHSHVYGLHRLTFVHENKAEKSMQWGESSFERAQRYLDIKYGEVVKNVCRDIFRYTHEQC